MNYSFTVVNSKNQHYLGFYDVENGILVSENKGLTFPSKSKNVTKELSIVMGTNCNLNCEYCFQQKDRKLYKPSKSMKVSDIEPLIQKLKCLDLSAVRRIVLWGGEPLLYFKVMKVLSPRLKQEFPWIKKHFFSTNGLLLTPEIINWCYNNDIHFQISDDGDNSFRGNKAVNKLPQIRQMVKDFLNEHPDAKISVHSVISKNNLDVNKIVQTTLANYGEHIGVSFASLHSPTEAKVLPKSAYLFTPEEMRLVYTSVFKLLTGPQRVLVDDKYLQYARKLFTSRQNTPFACPSGNGNQIAIDGFGNVFPCRSAPFEARIVLNDISKYPQHSWRELTKDHFTPTDARIHCKNCLIKNVCCGLCSIVPNQSIDLLCNSSFAFYFAATQAVLKNLFDVTITEIIDGDEHCKQMFNLLGDPFAYDQAVENYAKVKKQQIQIQVA